MKKTTAKSRDKNPARTKSASNNGSARNGSGPKAKYAARTNAHGIPDYRLEIPNFRTVEEWVDGEFRYSVVGDFSAPAPPLRESKYLNKAQTIEVYRYMLLNRKMEQTLENLFKQQKVVGGVYLGLGQEGCSCASAMALRDGDWIGPMIRNQ